MIQETSTDPLPLRRCKAPWVGASCGVDSNAAVVDAPPPPPPPNLGPPCPCGNGGQCVRTLQGKCAFLAVSHDARIFQASELRIIVTTNGMAWVFKGVLGFPRIAHYCFSADLHRGALCRPVCKCRALWIGASCMVDGNTVASGTVARTAAAAGASSSGPLPGWAVGVIVVGALALMALLATITVLLYRHARSCKSPAAYINYISLG